MCLWHEAWLQLVGADDSSAIPTHIMLPAAHTWHPLSKAYPLQDTPSKATPHQSSGGSHLPDGPACLLPPAVQGKPRKGGRPLFAASPASD